MKSIVIKILHSILGYKLYLYVFSIFKINTLSFFRMKWDYLFFVKRLKPDANVLVIGASTGITTIPIAKRCKQGKIFAYEPIEDNYNTIIKLLKRYRINNCQTYKIALSDKAEGKSTMLKPLLKGVKKQGLAHLNKVDIDKFEIYTTEEVEISTIDLRTELQDIKIDAIKLIAENSEFEILGGAKDTIQKNKPIIYCELWDTDKRDRVIERIESYGYQSFHRSKKELKPINKNVYRDRNLFFLPIES